MRHLDSAARQRVTKFLDGEKRDREGGRLMKIIQEFEVIMCDNSKGDGPSSFLKVISELYRNKIQTQCEKDGLLGIISYLFNHMTVIERYYTALKSCGWDIENYFKVSNKSSGAFRIVNEKKSESLCKNNPDNQSIPIKEYLDTFKFVGDKQSPPSKNTRRFAM